MPPQTPPSTPLLPAITFAVWASCAVVGGIGLALHYPRPHAGAPEPEPASAQTLTAETPKEPEPKTPEEPVAEKAEAPSEPAPKATPPAADDDAPPPPPAPPPLAAPDAPAFTAVAAPDAPVAFAMPVRGPTRVVPHELADTGRRTGSPKGVSSGTGTEPEGLPGGTGNAPNGAGQGVGAPRAQNLVFGQGEGAQAKPDYPREAQRRRQEGTVRVRFEVDEAGAVTRAEVEETCPFPLLNQAALSTVKRSWRFPAGPKRLYTVAIKFVLQ